jgi:hypothetical protein
MPPHHYELIGDKTSKALHALLKPIHIWRRDSLPSLGAIVKLKLSLCVVATYNA